ncbi:MAG: hypothetical protein ACOCT9_01695 [archaeon]
MPTLNFDIGVKEGPVADFFKRVNTSIDKTIPRLTEDYDKATGWLKDHATPLKAGGAAVGAGLLYDKIRRAQKNKLEREKLKSEKQYYDKLLDEKSKTAAPNPKKWLDNLDSNQRKQLGTAIGSAAATAGGTLAAKGAVDLYNKMKKKLSQKEKKYWDNFVQKYPEYKDNEKAKEYFSLFIESSPKLAKHPVAVKSFMKANLEVTEEGQLNFPLLKDISNIEKGFNKRDNAADREIGKAVKNLSNVARNAYEDIDYQTSDEKRRQIEKERMKHKMLKMDYNQKIDEYKKNLKND